MSPRLRVAAFAGANFALILVGFSALSRPTTPPVASRADTVRAVAPMDVGRAAHTATALPDGNVLIVGGFGTDETRLAGALVFDQQSERFGVIQRPQVLRQSHTATRLGNGTVLIAGGLGENGQYLDSAELYDPATRRFTPTGRMTTARSNHEAVLLDDGRVLILGGTGTGWQFLASAEIYDPGSGRFTAAGAMGEPRESHVAVKLRDGRVLVIGGHRGRGGATVISRTVEVYDPGSGRFTPTGAMATRRHKHDAVVLQDGRVLVLGGADERDNEGVYTSVEVFDPTSGTFQAGAPMRLGRYKHRGTSVMLADGRLLLAGGAPRVELYDPSTGRSTLVGSSSQLAGQFSAAALLPRGRVLITGGYGLGRGPRADAWVYTSSP
jgi:hypothetical protein